MNDKVYCIYVGGDKEGNYRCYGEYKENAKILKTTNKLEGKVILKDKNYAILRGIAESLFILKRKPPKVHIFINSDPIEYKKYLSQQEDYLSKAVGYMLSDMIYEFYNYKKTTEFQNASNNKA